MSLPVIITGWTSWGQLHDYDTLIESMRTQLWSVFNSPVYVVPSLLANKLHLIKLNGEVLLST